MLAERPLTLLVNEIDIEKQKGAKEVIILCRSPRAADMLKLALLRKCATLMGVRITSLAEYTAGYASVLGYEGKVVGSLGREMIISEALSEAARRPAGKKGPGASLEDYVRSFSVAIRSLKSLGIKREAIEDFPGLNDVKNTLVYAYEKYKDRLESSDLVDTYDLIRLVGDDVAKRRETGENVAIIAWYPDDDVAQRRSLNILGASVFEQVCGDAGKVPSDGIIMLKARQGSRLALETARQIKKIQLQKKIEYNRISIIVPPGGALSRKMAFGLDKAGVPCTEPLWMNLSEHPVGASLIAFMDLLSASDDKVSLISYISDPYWGMKDDEAEARVKSLSRIKGLQMELVSWTEDRQVARHFKNDGKDSFSDSAPLGKLVNWAKMVRCQAIEFKKNDSWKGYSEKLEEFVKLVYQQGLADSLSARSVRTEQNQKSSLSMEDEMLKSIQAKAVDGIVEITGRIMEAGQLITDKNRKIQREAFAFTLKEAIRQKRLLKKGAMKLGVRVCEASDMRGLECDVAAFFDFSDVNYPALPSVNWLLSEEDTNRLAGLNSKKDIVEIQREDILGVAGATNRTVLIATPSIGSDERDVNPSVWTADLIRDFENQGKGIEDEKVPRRISAAKSLAYCMTETERTLYNLERSLPENDDNHGFIRMRELNESTKKELSETTSKIVNDQRVWNPSSLNQYLRCNLAGFHSVVLNIGEQDEYDELATDKSSGSMYHDALKIAVEEIADYKTRGGRDEKTAIGNALAKVDEALSYDKSYRYADLGIGLWNLFCMGTKKALKEFIEEEALYILNNPVGFTPKHLEYVLGPGEMVIEGRTMKYKAKVDRIDIAQEAGETICAIYDYKTGKPPAPEEDIQVEFYETVVGSMTGYMPVASVYLSLKRKPEKGKTIRSFRSLIGTGFVTEEHIENLGMASSRNLKSLLRISKKEYSRRSVDCKSKLMQVITSIEQGEFTKKTAKSSHICSYCARRRFCWTFKSGADIQEDL